MEQQQLINDIDILKRDHKIAFWVIVSLLIICVLLVFKMFYGHKDIKAEVTKEQIKILTDSIQAQDKISAQRDKIYQEQRTRDSIRIDEIEDYVDGLPESVNKINKRYNDKRITVTNMPLNERVSFFASWLPQADTTIHR